MERGVRRVHGAPPTPTCRSSGVGAQELGRLSPHWQGGAVQGWGHGLANGMHRGAGGRAVHLREDVGEGAAAVDREAEGAPPVGAHLGGGCGCGEAASSGRPAR